MTRDEVLTEFGSAWRTTATDAMADEIVRLREQLVAVNVCYGNESSGRLLAERERDRAEATLAALREPSEAVIRAAQQKWDGDYCRMGDAIIAALAAAEKEVQGE